jgi:hypothetical protein
MPFLVTCPGCQQAFRAPESARGKLTRCPSCACAIAIQAAPAPPPAPAPAPAPAEVLDAERAPRRGRRGEGPDDLPRRRRRGDSDDRPRRVERHVVVVRDRGRGRDDDDDYAPRRHRVSVARFGHWHLVHGLLSLFTCGLWLPVWFIHWFVWSASQ